MSDDEELHCSSSKIRFPENNKRIDHDRLDDQMANLN